MGGWVLCVYFSTLYLVNCQTMLSSVREYVANPNASSLLVNGNDKVQVLLPIEGFEPMHIVFVAEESKEASDGDDSWEDGDDNDDDQCEEDDVDHFLGFRSRVEVVLDFHARGMHILCLFMEVVKMLQVLGHPCF